jgi:hypothetical protein
MILCEWDASEGNPGQSCVHLYARILSTSFTSVSIFSVWCYSSVSISMGRPLGRGNSTYMTMWEWDAPEGYSRQCFFLVHLYASVPTSLTSISIFSFCCCSRYLSQRKKERKKDSLFSQQQRYMLTVMLIIFRSVQQTNKYTTKRITMIQKKG